GKIFSMVLFALSCIGLLIFLWVEFGGTIPFNPQGYRFEASFPYAQELATPADVRIAGVSVGKVVGTSLDPKGNHTIATIQFGKLPRFAADASDIVQVLDIQHAAVVKLVQGGGTVFSAISRDPVALRNLITTGETTFNTTASQNAALTASFHVFPTFLNETKA